MVLYRRNRFAGGTYFFTVSLRDRSSDFWVRHVGLLLGAFRLLRIERPLTLDTIVILTDRLHTTWTLPEGDVDYSGRWRTIKSCFTRELFTPGISLTRNDRGKYQLWQHWFWEHTEIFFRDYKQQPVD